MATDSSPGRSFMNCISAFPMPAALRKRRYERYFATAQEVHIFRGIFESFEAAAASAPASKPLTYDNVAAATMYTHQLRAVSYDYPALFWMQSSFADGMRRVFDIGGSVGIKFFAFRGLMRFPADVSWTVEDMPTVVEQGRRFAATQPNAEKLTFTDRLGDGAGCDIMLASGSLQYLPQTLADVLPTLRPAPRRLIINTTPIHHSRSFYTLNNIGTAFCPYHVQSRPEFLGSISRIGYKLRDHWENVGKSMRIPFSPEHDVEAYSGFCFDRVA